MGTVIQSLKNLSSYPIPLAIIQEIADGRGLDGNNEATSVVRASGSYKLAKADVYDFLSEAPNISQGGISYNFSENERKRFKFKSIGIHNELGIDSVSGSTFGYQGEDL